MSNANTRSIRTNIDIVVWTAQMGRTRTEKRAAGARLAGNSIQICLAVGRAVGGWCLMMVIRTVLYARGVVLAGNRTVQVNWQRTAASAQPGSSVRHSKNGQRLTVPLQRTHGPLGSVSSAHQEGTQSRGQLIATYAPLVPLRTVLRPCATLAPKVLLDYVLESVLHARLVASPILTVAVHHAWYVLPWVAA